MLELKKITKVYNTKELKQIALNDISICFRKCQFVSILGPSGSGKTTLLNIIGGLDHYDSGDLIINEVSTKKYTNRDWDSYRNHRIGFVFQSYNLISHQTILQNVELALTLSGVSKKERIKKAKKALEEVGLIKHINKKPNELSGGQMQRVAIARALVNNPDILLADEPTGALDSNTSMQIMELLKQVAKDKLVIMVTHNPELAKEYSSRIIKLKDGVILDDSNYYDGKKNTKEDNEIMHDKAKKTSMSLLTALSLSLNNLMTKKWRTILTSAAGSIGIIGIALILSLSNGVQNYIDKTEKEALSSYPLNIEKTTYNLQEMVDTFRTSEEYEVICQKGHICTTDDISTSPELSESIMTTENNLTIFKKYLDNNGGNINDYVTDIKYNYDLDLQIYQKDTSKDIIKVNPNNFSLTNKVNNYNYPMMYMMTNNSNFKELINSDDLLNSKYDIISGKLPEKYNEVVLLVDENDQIPLTLLYALGIKDKEELPDIVSKLKNKEEVNIESINYKYDDLIGYSFKVILNTDYYKYENGHYKDMQNDDKYLKTIVDNGLDITVVGVLRANEEATDATSGYIGYTKYLTEYVINEINKTDIAKKQLKNKDINVLTNLPFNNYTENYETNCKLLGIVNLDEPTSINIYPKDFDSKEEIETLIKEYNDKQDDKNIITYTDMIGILLSSVSSIVDVVSYILIAFVAVSLVVSSIMIAIITYISVLERTKEIGILRAIGASQKDVSRVFNAETIIEGFVAGLIGVGIAYLLTIPINIIVKDIVDVSNIAKLPTSGAIILVIISVLLTVIAGLIPSKMASKKDPVESLRSE